MQKYNWISVNDRLPKQYEEVLLTDGEHYSTGFYASDNKTDWEVRKYYNTKPTHWIDLKGIKFDEGEEVKEYSFLDMISFGEFCRNNEGSVAELLPLYEKGECTPPKFKKCTKCGVDVPIEDECDYCDECWCKMY